MQIQVFVIDILLIHSEVRNWFVSNNRSRVITDNAPARWHIIMYLCWKRWYLTIASWEKSALVFFNNQIHIIFWEVFLGINLYMCNFSSISRNSEKKILLKFSTCWKKSLMWCLCGLLIFCRDFILISVKQQSLSHFVSLVSQSPPLSVTLVCNLRWQTTLHSTNGQFEPKSHFTVPRCD